MVRKPTGWLDANGQQLLAASFERLEVGRHFSFHESGQVMYRKNSPDTADRGLTTIHVAPKDRVHTLR